MPHFPTHLIAGVLVLVGALAVWAVTPNRLVRRKLRLTALLVVAYLAVDLFAARWTLSSETQTRLRSVEQLLIALAIINFLVAALLNPLRVDRAPDRFPGIVQDFLVVGLFMLVSTFVLDEKFLTTSAVGAVVVGFALQDTLGNAFSGLAIQVDKPFRVGHWVTIGNFEGRVTEITWRATKLRTKAGNLVIVPNSVMSKDAITNFSEPAIPTRMEVEVGATYRKPPNEVKAVIRQALHDAPDVLASPEPDVLVAGFGDSALLYNVRFWVADYERDNLARDQVRTAIYYAFHRADIEIPFPIQIQYERPDPDAGVTDRGAAHAALLGGVDVFAPLSDAERVELASRSNERLYGAGETIVRQGDAGSSMFVVCEGRARVTIEPGAHQVAVIETGGYFGEMSLLTGDPRTAAVSAVADCRLLEISVHAFRGVVMANPDVLEHITRAAATRRIELDAAKAAVPSPAVVDQHAGRLLARVRRFLRL